MIHYHWETFQILETNSLEIIILKIISLKIYSKMINSNQITLNIQFPQKDWLLKL